MIIIIRHIGSFIRIILYIRVYIDINTDNYIGLYTRLLQAFVVYSQPSPVNLPPLHGKYITIPPRKT